MSSLFFSRSSLNIMAVLFRMATNQLLLIGLRTIELRVAEWSEIDFDNAL